MRTDPKKREEWQRRSAAAYQARLRERALAGEARPTLPRRSTLPARSARRRAEDDAYTALRARVFARDRYRCQLARIFPDVPCLGSLEVSHTIPKGRWRGGYLVEANCLTACHGHGQLVHDDADALRAATETGAMGHDGEQHLLRAGWVIRG